MTTTTVDQIQQQASEWTEKIRVRLRELIESTGLTYKSISNETGIP